VKQLNYDKALCSIIVTTKLLFDCLVLLEENCLPTILEICQNKDCFFLFCDTFLSRIVVFTVWRDNYTKQKVSGVATVLDKAFAYLFIENYWDEWSTIFSEEYMGERSYDSSISKRKKRRTTWEKYTRWHYAG